VGSRGSEESHIVSYSTLKMEATGSSERLVFVMLQCHLTLKFLFCC